MAVLDGSWRRRSEGEDPDAPRRLYYVAMTRARHTLTLARMERSLGFQEELRGHDAIIMREAAELPPCPVEAGYLHVRPTLQDVDLGFAGRSHPGSPVHAAIASLEPGNPLDVRIAADGRWLCVDRAGRVVGRLARSFEPPRGVRLRSAEVHAVVGRSREATDPEYRAAVRCGEWEVVMPGLVFEPDR